MIVFVLYCQEIQSPFLSPGGQSFSTFPTPVADTSMHLFETHESYIVQNFMGMHKEMNELQGKSVGTSPKVRGPVKLRSHLE